MRFFGRFISGSGALLAFLFFFLPWVTVSCNGQQMATFSGWELASGISLAGEQAEGNPLLFLGLVFALLALLAAVFLRHQIAFALTEGVLGFLALLFLIWTDVQMSQAAREAARSSFGLASIELSPRVGLVGSFVSYALLLLGGAVEGAMYVLMKTPASLMVGRRGSVGGSIAPPRPGARGPSPPPERWEPPVPSDLFPPSVVEAGDEPTTDDLPQALGGAEVPAALLIVQNGPWRSRRFSLRSDDILLGRSRQCDIRFPDRYVSRRHARLRYARGQWFIQDQQSRGGTFVNGKRVNATRLNHGDVIRIGKTELRFQLK